MSAIEKTWSGTSDTKTFAITPTSTGAITLAPTSDPQLGIDPTNLSYDCIDVGEATLYTLTGPKTAPIGATSIPFTIAPKTTPILKTDGTFLDSGRLTGTITITLSGGLTGTITKTFSDSSDPQTFTIQPTSETQVLLTPSNDAGLPNASSLTCIGQVLETIDSTWLNTNAQNLGGGPGPWYLTSANTYYQIATSTPVTTAGTAFIVLATNVTLDLNGNTITYDNNTAPGVPNGGFETGSGTTIPNWDVTGASGAQIVSIASAAWLYGWWGDQVLQIDSIPISTTRTIISDPIEIPIAGVEYCAMVQPKLTGSGIYDPNGVYDQVTISVIDSSDNNITSIYGTIGSNQGSGDGGTYQPARGTLSFIRFIPTTTNSVRLHIQITPAVGTTTVNLDHADLVRSREYGIFCSPSWGNLPSYLWTTPVQNNASQASNTKIMNGTIQGGTGRAFGGDPIYARSQTNFVVDNVTCVSYGASTNQIAAENTTNATVTNCSLTNNMDLIDERMTVYAAIDLQNAAGVVIINNNVLRGFHHDGIALTGNTYLSYGDPGYSTHTSNITSLKINFNDIRYTAFWTDSYMMALSGCYNFEIAYNTMIPTLARGIIMDGQAGITDTGSVHDNYIEAREIANLEYTPESLGATALRVRSGTIKNVVFSNNVLAGYAGAGQVWSAVGARIHQYNNWNNSAHVNDNSNLMFTGNRFKAIVTSPDLNLQNQYAGNQAWALAICRVDTGTGLTFMGNTIESNITPLTFGDDDSYAGVESDVSFISNTIKMITDEGAAPNSTNLHPFVSIGVGDWATTVSNIRLIDMEYQNGAPSGFTFLGSTTKDVEVGYILTLTVLNSDSTFCEGATATVLDNLSNIVWPIPMPNPTPNPFVTTTDVNGVIKIYLPVTRYNSDTTTTAIGPFSISVTTLNSNSGSQSSYTINTDQSLTIVTNGIG